MKLFEDWKENESIKFIKDHEPPEGYMGCFSGGKDSCVIKHLVERSNVNVTWYYSLMPDPPQLIKFIRMFHKNVIFLRPKFSFWEGVVEFFPPHRKARWCCNYIKEQPSKKINLIHRILGIRAEESSNRAKLGRINQYTKKRINYHPIYFWTECDVWEYIDRYKIPVCELYDLGLSRIGCVVCPWRCGNKEQDIYKKLFPKYFKLFEKKVTQWWNEKGQFRDRGEKESAKSAEEFIKNWYDGK